MPFSAAALRLSRTRTSPRLVLSAALGCQTGEIACELNGCPVLKEGEAEILVDSNNSVFYNKTQVNNRDMSIAVLRAYISKRKEEHSALLSKTLKSKTVVPQDVVLRSVADEPSKTEDGKRSRYGEMKTDICLGEEDISREPTNVWKGHKELKEAKVLEALAASGLRALRYARELDGIGQVIALDNNNASVEACKKNILLNGSLACSKADVHLADAQVYMLTHPREFDAIDLDPYGSPSVFLDSAVQSVADGGILMCTATDMAVLCGEDGDVCYSRYGSYPLKGKYCHEMAIRILLACIENNSVRYAPGFGPVVSKECSECGKKFNMGGPIWSDPIHDQEWVASILTNVKAMKERYPAYEKIFGVLTAISEELPYAPLFVNLHNLSATLKCTSPSVTMFRSAVINSGYRISGSRINPLALKSDAPMNIIWDIMRCWVKKHPVKDHPSDQSGTVILSKEPTLQANFSRAAASLRNARAKKVSRFPLNPEKNWGPNIRAGRKITSKHVVPTV